MLFNILGTVCVRLIIFPLVIMAQRNAAKMNNNLPQLQVLQMKMTEARQTGNQFDGMFFKCIYFIIYIKYPHTKLYSILFIAFIFLSIIPSKVINFQIHFSLGLTFINTVLVKFLLKLLII
jgi:hypothetical protein